MSVGKECLDQTLSVSRIEKQTDHRHKPMSINDDASLTNIDKRVSYEEESVQNNNDNRVNIKNDKRKRDSHEPMEWKRIQEKRLTAFRNKQAEKKQKIQLYDSMKKRVEALEKILEENNIPMPNFDQ